MIGERIKFLREKHGWSQDELATKLGYKSRSSINKMELGIQDVPQRKIKEMAKVLGCTTGYLLEDEVEPKTPVGTLPVPDLSGLKKIPVLGHTACGSPIPAIREYDYLTIESTMKADFALVAEGKSMTGCGIMDGSLVLFQKTEAVDNGTVAAVTVGEATTIKKFYQYGNTVVLKPCNPEFDDQEYQGDELEAIYVFGKAIGCLTKL